MTVIRTFGCKQYVPSGNWVEVQSSYVTGLWRRNDNVTAFKEAVLNADNNDLAYSVGFVPEREIPISDKGIRVIGLALTNQTKSDTSSRQIWHIGYIPPKTAEWFHKEFLDFDVPIAGKLLNITERRHEIEGSEFFGETLTDINVAILGPEGSDTVVGRELNREIYSAKRQVS